MAAHRSYLLTHEIHVAGPHFRPLPMPVRPFKLRGDVVTVSMALRDLVDIELRRSGDTVGDDARTAVGVDRALVRERVGLVLLTELAVQMTVAHRR